MDNEKVVKRIRQLSDEYSRKLDYTNPLDKAKSNEHIAAVEVLRVLVIIKDLLDGSQ